MNLYAILPAYAPGPEVTFTLAKDDDEAMRYGVGVAARDVVDVAYCSPYAEVWWLARDVDKIGDAYALDAPPEWEWADQLPDEIDPAAVDIADGRDTGGDPA